LPCPALQFEEVFSKYDKDNKGGLTLSELNEMGGCPMHA
jgi:Ca2+-binding EF-hand superfamily protein